jgi:co-chaperonin GroES (HSP10)
MAELIMSKYLDNMQNGLKAAGTDNVVLVGSTLLVEVVKREARTASGLIMVANQGAKELTEAVVIATGAGFFDDETGEDKPLDTKVGDIVYVEPVNVRLLHAFPVAGYVPHEIGIIDESQILMRFRGADAVNAFRKGAGLDA